MSIHSRHFRLVFLIGLLVLVFATGLPVLRMGLFHQAEAVSFTLWGRISPSGGWGSTSSTITSPGPTITVNAGASVTMNLFSADGFSHRFCVDYNANQACDTPTEPESSIFSSSTAATVLTFTATTTPGTYTYFCTIHGYSMSGSFVVNAPPTPDFSISSNPTTLSLQQGSSGASSITLISLNSFTGTVSLSTSASPPGVTPSLNQTSVTLAAGTSHPVTLSVSTLISTAAGTYTVTIAGTSGSLSHSTTVAVTVVIPDFSIESTPTTLTVQPGKSGTSTITLASMGGFSGTVNLSTSTTQTSLTASLNPSSASLTSGGTVTLILSVSATNSTVQGNYPIVVNGTSGMLSHTITITVTVAIPSPAPQIPLAAIVTVGAISIIAAVAVVAYAVLRTRRKPP